MNDETRKIFEWLSGDPDLLEAVVLLSADDLRKALSVFRSYPFPTRNVDYETIITELRALKARNA